MSSVGMNGDDGKEVGASVKLTELLSACGWEQVAAHPL